MARDAPRFEVRPALERLSPVAPILLPPTLLGVRALLPLLAIRGVEMLDRLREIRAPVRVRLVRRGDLRAKAGHGEVEAPDFAEAGAGEELGLEGGVGGGADGVDDAVGLGLEPGEAAEPFPAVAEGADAFELMGAVEGGGEEVPF